MDWTNPFSKISRRVALEHATSTVLIAEEVAGNCPDRRARISMPVGLTESALKKKGLP
jgi:hypothetical protein